jgi:acyl dehydratase
MYTPEELKSKVGQEVGVTDWRLIDQSIIDRFADLTDDHQWIHVDREAAARGPFGSTIAHGFLVLSLMAKMTADAGLELRGARMGMNYGFDRVRITNVVRAGNRIRGRIVLKDLVERQPGQWLMTLGVTVEVEGQSKPAVVADWLGLQFVG